MSILKVTVAALLLATTVTGCATAPKALSHQYVAETSAGKLLSVQISMHTGMPGSPIQTVMLVYNTHSKQPMVIVQGQSKPLSEELTLALVSAITGGGIAAINGNYAIKVAEANCPPGTLCGTLVQVNNQAGATAGAEADASSGLATNSEKTDGKG